MQFNPNGYLLHIDDTYHNPCMCYSSNLIFQLFDSLIFAAYDFQADVSVIVLFLRSRAQARLVLDSVKRGWDLQDKSVVWIAPDYWMTNSEFLKGLLQLPL